jgi:hypothetical protein
MATLCLAGSSIACVQREILCDSQLLAVAIRAERVSRAPYRPASLRLLQIWDRLALEKLHFGGLSILSMNFWERMHGQVCCLHRKSSLARSEKSNWLPEPKRETRLTIATSASAGKRPSTKPSRTLFRHPTRFQSSSRRRPPPTATGNRPKGRRAGARCRAGYRTGLDKDAELAAAPLIGLVNQNESSNGVSSPP